MTHCRNEEGSMDHFGYMTGTESPITAAANRIRQKLAAGAHLNDLVGYRKADYHNPEAFMMQAAMNLMRFPKEVIEYVSAPTTGIQTRSKWPPSLAEIVEACVAEQNWCEKVARYSAMGPKTMKALPPPRFSAEDSYEAMFKKHGRPTGVFENVNDKWNNRRGA